MIYSQNIFFHMIACLTLTYDLVTLTLGQPTPTAQQFWSALAQDCASTGFQDHWCPVLAQPRTRAGCFNKNGERCLIRTLKHFFVLCVGKTNNLFAILPDFRTPGNQRWSRPGTPLVTRAGNICPICKKI